ncbi:MAG TPA: hypothetical protein ENK05_00575 [Gammaproteobacteria bacterium]|nr:hypothetical protein [Gammaproteobacteria bacterium]
MVAKNITLALAIAAVAGLSGCATTSDLDKLRDEVHQANATAEAAAAKADAASQEAAAASQTAADAKAAADDANSRIDRMFKKSMYK